MNNTKNNDEVNIKSINTVYNYSYVEIYPN